MINDKEVKTRVSPFAVRPNEIKVFDGKEGFASINQVVFKMDMGYISEDHIKALEVVNEFGFVTEVMSEKAFADAESKVEGVLNRIRIEG